MQDQRIPRSPRATHAGAYDVLNVMRMFDRLALGAQSVPELAADLRVEPRSARRITDRLRVENYLAQNGGHRRRYRPTLRLAALGLEVVRRSPLLRLADPVLADLAERTAGRAHLWIAGPSEPIDIARPLMTAHDDGSPTSARTVLDPDRDHCRSVAVIRHDDQWTMVAAIMDRGRVAAAVGLSGCEDLETTRLVVDAAARLEDDLAAAVSG